MADVSNVLAGVIPGVIGLGVKLGTAAPALKKPKRVTTARTAVAQAAYRQAAAAQGAAAGRGGSAAYAAREAGRTATQAAGQAAMAYSSAAAQDEAMYQNLLASRREAIANLGGDIASFAATTAEGAVEARDAAQREKEDKLKKQREEAGYVTGEPGQEVFNPTQPEPTLPGETVSQTPAEQQGIIGQPAVSQPPAQGLGAQGIQTELAQPAEQKGAKPVQEQVEPPNLATATRDAYRAATGLPVHRTSLYDLPFQEEQRLRLENLVWSEVERTGGNMARLQARIARYMAKMPQYQFAQLTGDTEIG